MGVRDFVLHNLPWKLTALLLAILVWSVIKFMIYKENTASRNQVLRNRPVMVLKEPGDTRAFRVDPPAVNVVVQAAKVLNGEDVEVFLDLTNMPEVSTALRQVLVRAAEPAKVIRIEPAFVMVDLVSPVDTALTNALSKP